jgi:hypothetical protein
MNRPATLVVFLTQALWVATGHAAEATPSDVYAEAVRIEHEVASLRRYLKVAGEAEVTHAKSAELRSEHVWSECYVILLKLGKLRRQLNLPYVEPIGTEPSLDMPLNSVWGMTQRILDEIHILKFFLDIPGQAPAAVPVAGKRPVDAFNKLTQISRELDLLSSPVTPTDAYSEAKRIDAEVDAALRHLRVVEKAVPPARLEDLRPKDSLRAVFGLLEELRRIERDYGMAMPEFREFDTGDKATPDDVLILVEMAIAELERVKARVGMVHRVTVPGTYEQNKKPADVAQLLGYIVAKLREVRPR